MNELNTQQFCKILYTKAQTRLQHFSKIISYLLLQNVKIKSFMANRT